MPKNQKNNHATSSGEDEKLLHSMGYKQELSRKMSGFSNFAISFAIICILAGGITAFPSALGAGGGIAIGLGWPLGCSFAIIVAIAMAQIASAYPTAGGLYHWSSILGGKAWGWVTGWINLLALIFVTASVAFSLYDPFFKSLIAPLFQIDTANFGYWHQNIIIIIILASMAFLNIKGIGVVSKLMNFSGYLIMVVALVLVISILAYSPVQLDFSRLWTFHNYTGTEGSVWPERIENSFLAFLPALILATYTVVGYDASAHTSEETHQAATNVPRGIVRAVLWSVLFGFIMVCSFVLALPDMDSGVKAGFGFLAMIMEPIPMALRIAIAIGIFIVNYLCGLACLTSTSRMCYAFARDGALPFSRKLRVVNSGNKTPVLAIWIMAILAYVATLYADAFLILAFGAAVYLYISYVMPIAAGLLAEGKHWSHKGPFSLGVASKPIAVLAVIGGLILGYIGMMPPNQKVFFALIGLLAVLILCWWVFNIRKHFKGPPTLDKSMQ